MSEKSQKKESKTEEQKHHRPLDEFGNHMEKFATRTAESIKRVIDKALASRNTVLTIRVNDECNEKLGMLVDAGLFKSRSESAAFLIQEGIKRQKALFSKITDKLKKIDEIRDELKTIVTEEMETKTTKG
jgi:Arc/MetJ-type ribon-helix-helix transcriptional regulator